MDEADTYQNLAALINNPPEADIYLIEVLPNSESNSFTYGDFRRRVHGVGQPVRLKKSLPSSLTSCRVRLWPLLALFDVSLRRSATSGAEGIASPFSLRTDDGRSWL